MKLALRLLIAVTIVGTMLPNAIAATPKCLGQRATDPDLIGSGRKDVLVGTAGDDVILGKGAATGSRAVGETT